MNKDKIYKFLDLVKSFYKDFTVGEEAFRIWYKSLEGYTPNELFKCLERVSQTQKYTPKLADFLEILNANKPKYEYINEESNIFKYSNKNPKLTKERATKWFSKINKALEDGEKIQIFITKIRKQNKYHHKRIIYIRELLDFRYRRKRNKLYLDLPDPEYLREYEVFKNKTTYEYKLFKEI